MSHLDLNWTLNTEGQLYGTATIQTFSFQSSLRATLSPNVEVRLKPGSFTNGVFAKGIYNNPPSPGFGVCSILNSDGKFDSLNDYVFDGRTATLFGTGTGLFNYAQVSGTVASFSMNETEITFRLRDFQEKLDRPFPFEKYLGTNENGSGQEGGPDLAGVFKNALFGFCRNIQPVLVNTQYGIWDCGYSPIPSSGVSVSALYLDGIKLTGTSVANVAALYTTPVPSGGYLYFANYVRIYPQSSQTLTVDAAAPGGSAFFAAEAIIEAAGLFAHPSLVLRLSFSNFGLMVNSETTFSALLNTIAESTGTAWFFSSGDTVDFFVIDEPYGATDFIYPYEILQIELESSGASSSGVPYKTVTVETDINYTSQSDPSPATPADHRNFIAAEFRTFSYTNPYTSTIHPLADSYLFRSYLDRSEAQQVAGRLLRLLSLRRDTVKITCAMTANTGNHLVLGKNIQLLVSRFAYGAVDDGRNSTADMRRNFTIVGYTVSPENQTIEFYLFGATRLQDDALLADATDYLIVQPEPVSTTGLRVISP